ncbi:unnamed protein product, partial [Laminaria digitata]
KDTKFGHSIPGNVFLYVVLFCQLWHYVRTGRVVNRKPKVVFFGRFLSVFPDRKPTFRIFGLFAKKTAETDRYFRFFPEKSVGFGRSACNPPPTETDRVVGENPKNR